MTPDKDLQFLQFCKNDDLVTLCNILTQNNKGKYRINEQLTKTDSYIKHYPNEMNLMWKDVAWELQCYGGNTLLNVFARHGRGPAYEEIVSDVCRKMKVKVSRHAECAEMEMALLEATIDKALGKMGESEVRELCKELNISYTDKLPRVAVFAALAVARKTCFSAYTYLVNIIIQYIGRMLVGRGILTAAATVASRLVNFALGPAGIAVMAGKTVWDIAGPAYRVIIPAVIQVTLMRLAYRNETEERENAR